jgi:thymidylate synthase
LFRESCFAPDSLSEIRVNPLKIQGIAKGDTPLFYFFSSRPSCGCHTPRVLLLQQGKDTGGKMMRSGNIPVLTVSGKTLPEAWEKSVLEVWKNGLAIHTEYDREGDPPSRDATMALVIEEPFGEPRIHRAFPAGLEELEVYRLEVVDGVHDHWIDPAAGKWTYTYHKRIFDYEIEGKHVDQIAYVVDKLSSSTITRRAQAITWNPALDPPTDDPPCLQRLWFRLVEKAPGAGSFVMNMNTHWRSRDAYKAAFMNIFALTDLMRVIAERISKKMGAPVELGRYADISDSYHIYGSYFSEFEGFLKLVEKRTFEQRTWHSSYAEPMFAAGRERVANETK